MMASTVAMAGFTGALVLTTFLQWRVANDQLEQMRREQRAWLGIDAVAVDPPKVGNPFVWHLSIRNSGATPGVLTLAKAKTVIRPEPVDIDQHFNTFAENRRSMSIAPNQSIRAPITNNTRQFTQSQVEGIQDGTTGLYVIGELHYTDVLQRDRKTIYCLKYNRDTQKLACIIQCAVQRRHFSVGENPTRQVSFQPVAIGTVVEVTKQ